MKIAAAHQPNLLPWLPWWQKVLVADHFVLCDDLQFVRREFHNRVRVLEPQGRVGWLTLPVTHHLGQQIMQTQVAHGDAAVQGFLKKVRACYGGRRWPGRAAVAQLVAPPSDPAMLLSWTSAFIKRMWTATYGFGLPRREMERRVIRSSTLRLPQGRIPRIVALCDHLGCDAYLSGRGAADYLSAHSLAGHGVRLLFQPPDEFTYRQPGRDQFIPGLSCLDAVAAGVDFRNIVEDCSKIRDRLEME